MTPVDEKNPFEAEISGRFADEDLCENKICSCIEVGLINCTCTERFPELNLIVSHHRSPASDVNTVRFLARTDFK